MDVVRFRHLLAGTVLVCLCRNLTFAQQETTLTLEQSLQIAKQTNLSFQTAQEQVKSAEAQAKLARAALLPKVNVSSSYTYIKDLPKSVIDASSGFGPPAAGGETPPADSGASDSGDVIELEFGAHHNFDAQVALSQPIFAWGRYYYGYKSATLNVEAARKELIAAENQLVLDVTEAFYRVLLAQEFIAVSERTVKLVEEQLRIAQAQFNAGASTNFDVLRAEVLLANARSQLIRARNQSRIAMDAYKNVLNLEMADNVNVQGSLERPVVPLELDALIRGAMENRPELQQFAFSQQAAEKQVAVAKTGNRPDLSFFSTYRVEDNERLEEMNRIWNVGFQLNFPIFDGLATRAAVGQAESGLRQVELGEQQLTDSIEFEVRSAYLNLLEAKALIEVQRQTVEQGLESVRIATMRFENGIITGVELTDAQIALAQAEVNRLQAYHDYAVGLARLEKAIGQPLAEQ